MAMLLTKPLMRWMERLSYPRLFTLAAVLFGVNMLVIDPIPFVDEILFGVVTLLLAGLKKRYDPADAEPAATEPLEGQANRR